MLLLELTHTSHTLAATGIQQVCRNLFSEIGKLTEAQAIVHDPWQKSWRTALRAERIRLRPNGTEGVARKKGEVWKTGLKIRGRLKLWTGVKGPIPEGVTGVLFPEFYLDRCIAALPELRGMLPGVPVAAVFHDAIALRFPNLSARATVERFPKYIASLASFDAVAAVSEASKKELLGLWEGMGIKDTPPVVAIPLGITKPREVTSHREKDGLPHILCVATLEPRKNHLALLDAAEALWKENFHFKLVLIGMAHRELGGEIVDRIRELERAHRDIAWLGAVDNNTLYSNYAACDFTVYPSLMEGFGLPVLESLARGKPCVCSTCGGLDEVSRGGGCLRLDDTGSDAIAAGLRSMLVDADLRARLNAEVAARPVRTWADYATDILEFMSGLECRAK
jgi:glycosyltransferase involved in cell wall biosynthesis